MDMGLGGLQESVMDREAWRATIHGVTKSWTWLSDWTELPEITKEGKPLSYPLKLIGFPILRNVYLCLFVFNFFFFFGHVWACGILASQPGTELVTPALGAQAQSLNHWTTREVPIYVFC